MELPPIGTNAYLVRNPETGQAVLIDAPQTAFERVQARLAETGDELVALLMTHGHWDHTLDGHLFNEAGVGVMGHQADESFYTEPEQMAYYSMPGLEMKPMQIDGWLEEGDELELLGEIVEVRHVPGHCPGSILFWFKNQGVAFVGDAIFNKSIGRTDLPGGSLEDLTDSIRGSIYTLPEETVLFPGHGPHTTVADEMKSNPYIKGV